MDIWIHVLAANQTGICTQFSMTLVSIESILEFRNYILI